LPDKTCHFDFSKLQIRKDRQKLQAYEAACSWAQVKKLNVNAKADKFKLKRDDGVEFYSSSWTEKKMKI
jgi:hypothetical protein